jgi:hypothetical protein
VEEEDGAKGLLVLLPREREDYGAVAIFFWEKRKIGTEAATGPSSSGGRGKVEQNSLCSFFFWREGDGDVFLLSFWRKRKMELKSYFLSSIKRRQWSSVIFFRKKRKIGAEAATGPSSFGGRGMWS